MIQTVIHFSKRIASYVYLRGETYYFQLRLKNDDTRQQQYKSGLIRKSLKTGNYTEAIQKARFLWLKYMTDSKKSIIQTQDEIEEAAQRKADLYSRGKELHQMFRQMDQNDENQLNEFFAHEFGTAGYSYDFDAEAFESYADNHVNQSAPQSASTHVSGQNSNKGNVALNVMIDKFINENQNSASAWGRSQLEKYKKELAFFCAQMKNCKASELTSENIRNQYINKLHLLPTHAHRHKFLHDKNGKLLSIDQVIQLAKQHNLDTLSVRTYRNKAEKVQSFLRHLEEEEYIDTKPLNAFSKIKNVKKDKKHRPAFTEEQLQLLFNCKEFYQGAWHKKYLWRHWGLLLALYTGARVNEICQLDVDDIIKDKATGIHYINIKKSSNKSLKTANSSREVPVHKTLIALGFLNYVEHQKRKKENKLFSELTCGHDGKWCRKLKDWFNEKYLKQVGIDKYVSENHTTLSFHSFRNTVINYEKQHGLERSVMEEVVGHEKAVKETTHDDYADLYNLKNRKREIDKLYFNIDVKDFRVWR